MEPEGAAWLLKADPGTGDALRFATLGGELATAGHLELAATAYDLAFGLLPDNPIIADARNAILDKLSVTVGSLRFRYVPGGTFLMGSELGDDDERPVHLVEVDAFWMSDTPVSWAAYCDILGWQPPPMGRPLEADESYQSFSDSFGHLREENKIRLQYCEDGTTQAHDWHAHAGILYGPPPREDPRRPIRYDRKPMVSVSWQDAELLCAHLSHPGKVCRLPSEAEWEKAARGGLIGKRYPWGDTLPDHEQCDFDRFNEFSIQPFRRFSPNSYGLYAMSGCVWEWTSDWYDVRAYARKLSRPYAEEGVARALRGGSWADCAEAVTVSFRMSRGSISWGSNSWGDHVSPNIGFRLCLSSHD